MLRIETVVKSELTLDLAKLPPLELDPNQPGSAEIAPSLASFADYEKLSKIDLEEISHSFRLQRLVFQAARKVFAELGRRFKGAPEHLAAQLVCIVESFLKSDKLKCCSLFHSEPIRQRILIAKNTDRIVQHVMSHINEQNTEELAPVFDEEKPIGATGQMRTWYTAKPCFLTIKSHISHLVGDSAWEGRAANIFEQHKAVVSYAKNDHLGFQIQYLWRGSRRRYVPDFLLRLACGKRLVLEIKGEDNPQSQAKRDALSQWVEAINGANNFGRWACAVAYSPHEIQDILIQHASAPELG